MATKNPRAFISHTSQDRAFVEKFAADLRANGVDAWYAGWEIKPGDSIRARLDEGLAECEIFIIVLSRASINRPWVQTELDAATVRKLDGKVQKIIPIRIDDCGELPPTLGALLWEDFSKERYEVAFKRVLNSIFRVETKPPLGSIPDLPPLVASRQTKISATTAIFWTAMAVAVVMIASRLTVNIGMPPWIGQLTAGVILAGTVWKFFERVEALLTENTRLEIAVWLSGRIKLSPGFQSWPDTFVHVFDRVFGERHLSWKCFLRSATATVIVVSIFVIIPFLEFPNPIRLFSSRLFITDVLLTVLTANLIPDYISLLESRLLMRLMQKLHSPGAWITLLLADLGITSIIALVSVGTFVSPSYLFVFKADVNLAAYLHLVWSYFTYLLAHPLYAVEGIRSSYTPNGRRLDTLYFYPAFFTSIWLWLYAGCGFLLKAARRFDLGFDWFNRKFDIEKKPLQSIGLVAGALVAVVYWAVVAVAHFLT